MMNIQQYIDSPKLFYYSYSMKTAFILYLIMVVLIFGGLILSSFFFNYFPTSKISNWFRRHLITDEDYERPEGNSQPSDGSDS